MFTDLSEVTEKASEFYKINSFSQNSLSLSLSPSEVPHVNSFLLLSNLKKLTYLLYSDILDL